jgi:hypothetical protein
MAHRRLRLRAGVALSLAAVAGWSDGVRADVLGPGAVWLSAPSPSDFDGITALGDVTGDGKADLVVYNQMRGVARVGVSTGSGFQPLRTWTDRLPTQIDGKIVPFSVADVTGDGSADLVVFRHGDGQTPGSAEVLVVTGQGLPLGSTRRGVWNAGFCVSDQTCAVDDVNGDGKADLVAFTQDFGLVWTSLSNGSGFGVNAVWHQFFCVRGERCALGDVDGDAKADIIAFKPAAPGVEQGNVLVAASTGAGFGAPRLGHGFFCIGAETCLVGDLNADKRDDVLLVKHSGGVTAEVLASLSNGVSFINADPFRYAELPRPSGATGFGLHLLADVTGDGRADLVAPSVTSVIQPGGSATTVGKAYLVYPVLAGVTAAPATPPAPADPGGVEHLLVVNCDPDRHPLTYHIADLTTGEVTRDGPHETFHGDTGFCPDNTLEPFTFDFEPGRVYEFVAVDPLSIGCEGRDDPTIVSCRKHAHAFLGSSNGRKALLNLQPGPALSVFALQLNLPRMRLAELQGAGIDFSVREDEILDWLGNEFSGYIQFSEGLVALFEGRRLKRPVFIDVVFFEYEQAGGVVALDAPAGALDAVKAQTALLRAHNVRYGEAATDWAGLLEP